MLRGLHANKTSLRRPRNNGRGRKSEHGQTMTDGEHLIQLQQVGAQHGTKWSDGPHSSQGCPEITSARYLTRCWRHLIETFPEKDFQTQVEAISAALCFDICSLAHR